MRRVKTPLKFWNEAKLSLRRRAHLWLLSALAAGFILAIFLILDEERANAGYLILGGVIATFAAYVAEWAKRASQARELARALYVELADRVA